MKKIVALVILAFALGSCSQDLKFNNVAVFQGVKDNESWVGSNASASITGSTITIQAVTLTETMALTVPVPTTTIVPTDDSTHLTYVLGTTNSRTAAYSRTDGDNEYVYKTGIGIGDGEVVIKEFDGTFISGTFRFNAKNTDATSTAPELVNMQSGVFYKVPIVPAQ